MAGQFIHYLISLMQMINGQDHYLIKLLPDSNLSSRRWVTYTYSHAHNKRNFFTEKKFNTNCQLSNDQQEKLKAGIPQLFKKNPLYFIHERFSKLKNTHYLKEELIFQIEWETGQGIQAFHVICQYDNTRAITMP